MKFSVDMASDIVNSASKKLQSRTLGGVTKESALEALQKGVSQALENGEAAIGKVRQETQELLGKAQQELQAFKNKSAQEMAELTSQKDSVILQTKQEAKKQIAAAKSVKQSTKVLQNGNTIVRKVNKNGAVMEKEINPSGQTIRASVTTLDGDYRKTTFNPINGKPVKTYTNVNGDKLVEYSSEGVVKSSEAVNVKKVASAKSELVAQTKPEQVKTGWSGERAVAFDRIYSDGSKENITRVTDEHGKLERIMVNKFDAEGCRVSEHVSWASENSKRTRLYGKNKQTEINEWTEKNGLYHKVREDLVYDETISKWIKVGGENSKGGVKVKYKIIKDEFGLYTDRYIAKITYPKGQGKPVEVREGTFTEVTSIK